MWLGLLVVGVISGMLLVACLPKRERSPTVDVPEGTRAGSSSGTETERSRPVGFGYKTTWLSIRTSHTEAVVRALGLVNPRRAGWSEGVAAGYEHEVFVSPAIEGWTFVVWSSLPSLTGKSDPVVTLLTELSTSLQTEVQYFGTDHVVEYHAWARADRGELKRGYAYVGESGETLFEVGEQSAEEKALGFRFFDERSPKAQSDDYWEREDLSWPSEESVLQLAGSWSIDPTTLEDLELETEPGWIGRPK